MPNHERDDMSRQNKVSCITQVTKITVNAKLKCECSDGIWMKTNYVYKDFMSSLSRTVELKEVCNKIEFKCYKSI